MGTRAEKAGCGAPLVCSFWRAGRGADIHLRFTLGWRHGRASGLERVFPALNASRRYVFASD
ncbi:hypothetical protein PMIN01_08889 [Paraphaeosphaeria minitans]|uniref:Uncharacterized protein n=1 Tax=Paraphaeosphaeria minitans TaxID=565426 RepID=A0A9P6GCK8_9PLEO|nr:hypothetical protein PMIN01_08889 [Paraphaeosphaeria minitans]